MINWGCVYSKSNSRMILALPCCIRFLRMLTLWIGSGLDQMP